jgi:hypothetical protein
MGSCPAGCPILTSALSLLFPLAYPRSLSTHPFAVGRTRKTACPPLGWRENRAWQGPVARVNPVRRPAFRTRLADQDHGGMHVQSSGLGHSGRL